MKNTLFVVGDPVIERPSFFSRQFRPGRTRPQVIWNFYQDATGEDIERRLMILND